MIRTHERNENQIRIDFKIFFLDLLRKLYDHESNAGLRPIFFLPCNREKKFARCARILGNWMLQIAMLSTAVNFFSAMQLKTRICVPIHGNWMLQIAMLLAQL